MKLSRVLVFCLLAAFVGSSTAKADLLVLPSSGSYAQVSQLEGVVLVDLFAEW